METVVRMGEASASNTPADVLACIGLGSCIGLALVDRSKGVAALAHVMLPESAQPDPPQPHKFADLAVPALVDLALAHGAASRRLEAAVAGGAAMFQLGGSGQDIGARNAHAVARLLDAAGIPVRATATGGSTGRTLRIHVGSDIAITVREAGGREEQLLGDTTHTGRLVIA
ncbi:MAG TPA: chemotaxis protein CheD [Baekduia sp.]|uniref:chemotaxis protein CheD n=1 Tax=Baekduia sp. TaxID=2600305 RepID=UPI002C99C06D|nr:chemotaxis protein CheD [Baekduia sp.]HMJ33124.1 chemotaxis protein CheD [Baekduia sp.]